MSDVAPSPKPEVQQDPAAYLRRMDRVFDAMVPEDQSVDLLKMVRRSISSVGLTPTQIRLAVAKAAPPAATEIEFELARDKAARVDRLEADIARLGSEIRDRDTQVVALEMECDDRQMTIGRLEQRISDLEWQNAELKHAMADAGGQATASELTPLRERLAQIAAIASGGTAHAASRARRTPVPRTHRPSPAATGKPLGPPSDAWRPRWPVGLVASILELVDAKNGKNYDQIAAELSDYYAFPLNQKKIADLVYYRRRDGRKPIKPVQDENADRWNRKIIRTLRGTTRYSAPPAPEGFVDIPWAEAEARIKAWARTDTYLLAFSTASGISISTIDAWRSTHIVKAGYVWAISEIEKEPVPKVRFRLRPEDTALICELIVRNPNLSNEELAKIAAKTNDVPITGASVYQTRKKLDRARALQLTGAAAEEVEEVEIDGEEVDIDEGAEANAAVEAA